jgi:hypothetical protein
VGERRKRHNGSLIFIYRATESPGTRCKLEDSFCILLSEIQPTAEVLAKLPAIAARTWETRKTNIADEAKILSRRLGEQRALNLKAIQAKVNGELSGDDFLTLKTSIAGETSRIETAMKALDSEKSSYTDLMQQAEAEVICFEKAWRDGRIHRKRELQSALFPEGLDWWIKRRVFETGEGLTIADLGAFFDTLSLIGVPDGI